MTTYYITPYELQEWETKGWKEDLQLEIDTRALAEALQDKWTHARIYPEPSAYTALEWDFEGFTGRLQSNRYAVAFEAVQALFIEFVLWYRKFVSPTVPLFLTDDSSSRSVELKPTTTEHDVVEFITG